MNRLPIRWKITMLIFAIVSFSMLLSGVFIISDFFHTKEHSR
ncbi:hypothetical protein [Geobacillus sp. CAMR5420]|nr:hypothetical protein [Geobacillus sp. CAMR5420]